MEGEAVWWSLSDQLAAIHNGTLAAEDLAQAYLARIDRFDGELASFVAVDAQAPEQGRATDAAIRAGQTVAQLAGGLIGVKDNYTTQAFPTRAGTEVADLDVPREDSFAVQQIRAAGGQHHAGAFFSQQAGRGLANPAGCARNYDNLIRQLCHSTKKLIVGDSIGTRVNVHVVRFRYRNVIAQALTPSSVETACPSVRATHRSRLPPCDFPRHV
jgi:hypothetical protein